MLLTQGTLVDDAEPFPTPWIIKTGGKKWQVLPVTTSDQVIMSNGATLETRMITLEKAVATNPSYKEVANLDERDAIVGLIPGDKVYVSDATGDPSVKKGGATYVYKSDGTWRKDAEDESMDQVCVASSEDGDVPEELRDGGLLFSPVDFNTL